MINKYDHLVLSNALLITTQYDGRYFFSVVFYKNDIPELFSIKNEVEDFTGGYEIMLIKEIEEGDYTIFVFESA